MATLEEMVKVNKAYFVQITTSSIEIFLDAQIPFLLTPPWNYLSNKAIKWLVNGMADVLEKLTFYEFIDLRVSQQGKDYYNAKLRGLKAVISGNEQEIKDAEEDIKNKFRILAKFTT